MIVASTVHCPYYCYVMVSAQPIEVFRLVTYEYRDVIFPVSNLWTQTVAQVGTLSEWL